VDAARHRSGKSTFSSAHALLMLGLPGAGKGTQALEVSREFGIPAISTGAMLRDAVNQRTSLGVTAQPIMESGGLVPDDLVCALVEERVSHPDCDGGFILDGFPRNLEQAAFLERLLAAKGWGMPLALYIRVDPTLLFKRLTGRRVCPVCGTNYNIYFNPPRREGLCDREGARLTQRPDDNEEAVAKRLKEFEAQTQPLIEHYRESGLLRDINGDGEAAEVTREVFRILREL
jgi:adenylate kinase